MRLLATITDVPRLLSEYIAEGRRHSCQRSQLLRYLPVWLWSVTFSNGSLTDRRPWITFPAARFLDQILSPGSRVFEYGAGGSSLYFAQRVSELVSVDHDAAWLQRTMTAMKLHCSNAPWRPYLAEPVPNKGAHSLPHTHPGAYSSTDPSFAGMSFQQYAAIIDRYPDNHFDIVLIDGRARPSCFKHAVTKVKVGGYIILDNAEREQYAYVEEFAHRLQFRKIEFWGPGPYNRYFWRTIFLQKIKSNFALNDLDLKLERYLDFDSGTFIEVGGNDGVSQSNTLYFELYRGWHGLLVEAVPDLANACRLYRPNATVEQFALVEPEHVGETVTIRYANLMSVIKGGMKSQAEEDAHIEAGMRVQNIGTYEITVPTTTLSALLDKHGMGGIDLLSLDVEGYELKVLKGLDLSRHRPRFILVEARYRAEVHEYLRHLYDPVAELSHHDLLYRLKTDDNSATRQ